MRISDIQIDDVLRSTIYEHSIRVLSRPRMVEDCWVVDAIHVTGEHVGTLCNTYHVTNSDMPNGESSLIFVNSEFTPIKRIVKLNLNTYE
jgi:hypothetical protein